MKSGKWLKGWALQQKSMPAVSTSYTDVKQVTTLYTFNLHVVYLSIITQRQKGESKILKIQWEVMLKAYILYIQISSHPVLIKIISYASIIYIYYNFKLACKFLNYHNITGGSLWKLHCYSTYLHLYFLLYSLLSWRSSRAPTHTLTHTVSIDTHYTAIIKI